MADTQESFNKELRKAKTPGQVYKVYTKHSDYKLGCAGAITLAYFDDYVNEVVTVLKVDRHHQRLNSNGHRSDAMTKRSAVKLMRSLDKYTKKLLDKLSKAQVIR
jgi:hypothetical protein